MVVLYGLVPDMVGLIVVSHPCLTPYIILFDLELGVAHRTYMDPPLLSIKIHRAAPTVR